MSADESRITAAVVDDEQPARALVREYLSAHPDITVVAECANGFEVLDLLDPGPAVVFCTAYDEYALKAFEVHAVDYLLKPFGRERFAEALARVRARLREAAQKASPGAAPVVAMPRPGELAASARPPGRWIERVLVKDGPKVQVIPVEKLDYIEAQDDYVSIHAEGKTWLKNQPLAELEKGLDPACFVRVHRSYIIHLDRLARLEPYAKDSRVAVLKDGKELPVSRAGYARLKELM